MYICMYLRACASVCVRKCVCVCAYTHTHTHTNTWSREAWSRRAASTTPMLPPWPARHALHFFYLIKTLFFRLNTRTKYTHAHTHTHSGDLHGARAPLLSFLTLPTLHTPPSSLGACVCVCVCEWVREREKEREWKWVSEWEREREGEKAKTKFSNDSVLEYIL